MRTTVTLDDDVAAEIQRLRREQHLGLSAALNRLVRRGMAAGPEPTAYEHESHALGIKVDVTNIAEVLDLLDDA